ncbi:MAG: hypothetical protein GY867_10340, partial [bacterium]|nr:hypothetical protein [bacterium]
PDPDCQVDTPGWIDQVPDTLCYLKFRTLHDSTTVGRFHPVRFYWQDCTDNLLTSGLVGHAGPYLYGSADVYDHGSNEPINETIGVYYPTFLGAQEECMDLPTIPDVMAPVRNVNFYNGGVEFAPDAPDRNRGDINRNGIAFEIADVVMFSFYFLNDTLAFGDHVAQSAAASDINGDGLLLTMEDFILLWRIAEGERSPDDPPPPPSQHTARFEYIPVTGQVSVYTPDTLGGVFLKFRGEPTGGCDTIAPYAPVCSYDGEFTRVFKWSAQEGQFTLEGEIMTLTGDLELVEVQTATYTGAKVNTEII